MKLGFMISSLFYLISVMLIQNEVPCNGCLENERIALLDLKDFYLSTVGGEDEDELSSWVDNKSSNCCYWQRVKCSNISSGHIIQLSLHELLQLAHSNWMLNVSFFRPFAQLRYLDLSGNSIEGFTANKGFLRSKEMEILNLSDNNFNCNIISKLHEFTSLKILMLRQNRLNCSLSKLDFTKFNLLEHLDLSRNELTSSLHVEGFPILKTLKTLDLSFNFLYGSILPNLNRLKALTISKLDGNSMEINLSVRDMSNLENLKLLDLRSNELNGSIEGLCKLKNLVKLDISYNMLSAPLPLCLRNLTKLKVLNFGYNFITGNFPSFTSNLTSLTFLSLYNNYMQGSFSLSTLANHSRLQGLYISSQSIGAHIETENIKWFPKFQLKYLVIRNCNLNMEKGNVIPSFLSYQYNLILIDISSNNIVGSFPRWLEHNDGIKYLDISNNSLSGWLPKDIVMFLPTVTYLKISRNNFEGNIPSSIGKMKKLKFLDFSYNHFSGYLPKQLTTIDLRYLKLSNNFLQGSIPKFSDSMMMLFLNNNNFSGTLEEVLEYNTSLTWLDISNNSISGRIPSGIYELYVCLMNTNLLEGYFPVKIFDGTNLQVLDLSGNKLVGSIPSGLDSLEHLCLKNNGLSGSIPFELSGNSLLKVIDLSENKFSGKIPNWVDSLSELRVLLLGGNNLEGDIPIQLCRLKKMNMMDLSRNMLKSSVPSCFQNLSFGIKQYDDGGNDSFQFSQSVDSFGIYEESFTIKNAENFSNDLFDLLKEEINLELEFRTKNNHYIYKGKILEIMTGLDLSCNKLTGIIPFQIGDMQQIKALNLSHNYFSGHIPISFSNLTQIESLDLSYNNLSGKIPDELTQLTFLSIFNVSYNNFSGTPPSTGQFADFDEENYKGNPGLCGPLLNRKCKGVKPPPSSQSHDNGEKETKVDMISFYWSFAASYITILLSIITVLYINAHWRMVWFYFMSKIMRKCFPTFPILY